MSADPAAPAPAPASAVLADPAAAAPAAGELPASVTRLEHDGVEYFVVGTAHVSAHSVAEVRSVIAQLSPDVVAVELCKPRYEALTQENAFRNLDIFKVIREGKTLYLMAHLALAAYQRRMGAALGVKPGAELLAGVEAGRAAGARVELIDREINTTLKRTWANIGFWKRSLMLSSMIVGGEESNGEPVTADSIEKLKDEKQLSTMLDELAKAFPEVKGPLIDERDRYMVSKLVEAAAGATDTALPAHPVTESAKSTAGSASAASSAAGALAAKPDATSPSPAADRAPARPGPARRVVAVVGAAHVPGMRATFGKPIDRKVLEVMPKPSWWWTALKWAVPILLVAGLIWGLRSDKVQGFVQGGHGTHTVLEVLMAWIAPTSIGAGLLTLLTGGSILTVLTAVVVAPIAAIHPLLATAMVTGVVEAWRRKPSVADCEALAEDTQSLRGFWRNPVTHTLIVAIASGLGTAIGMWIGVGYVVKMLT